MNYAVVWCLHETDKGNRCPALCTGVHSARGATSNVSGAGCTTRSEQSAAPGPPAAPGPAVRRSARAQVTAARTAAAGGADSGVGHPRSAARRRGSVDVRGGGGDADMFDASEALDDSEGLGRNARDAAAAAHPTLHHHYRVSEEALMMSPASLQRHESEAGAYTRSR